MLLSLGLRGLPSLPLPCLSPCFRLRVDKEGNPSTSQDLGVGFFHSGVEVGIQRLLEQPGYGAVLFASGPMVAVSKAREAAHQQPGAWKQKTILRLSQTMSYTLHCHRLNEFWNSPAMGRKDPTDSWKMHGASWRVSTRNRLCKSCG